MAQGTRLTFGPFALDMANEALTFEGQPRKLTPKSFAVLRTLAERAGQLVTKDALFETVWPETVVSDAALSRCAA